MSASFSAYLTGEFRQHIQGGKRDEAGSESKENVITGGSSDSNKNSKRSVQERLAALKAKTKRRNSSDSIAKEGAGVVSGAAKKKSALTSLRERFDKVSST